MKESKVWFILPEPQYKISPPVGKANLFLPLEIWREGSIPITPPHSVTIMKHIPGIAYFV